MKKILIKNAKIITVTGISLGELLVQDGKIKEIGRDIEVSSDTHVMDAQGLYLAPGFIELHTHGAGNSDFMDGSLEDIYKVCETQLNYGVTSIVPTSITSTKESLLELVDLFNQVDLEREGYPRILGLHLEGPYFAFNQ
ncbi:MAG: amidohydrolase family protein, partial [Clostridium sp.]|nr:amidohydrolase family protein [Clostridium sp.]